MKYLEWAVVWMVGSVLVAVILLSGCGSGRGSEQPSPAPNRGSPVGYGLANYWHTVDPVAFADLLATNGLNLTVIELMPWFTVQGGGCKHNGGLSDQLFPQEAVEFVDAMRDRGITTIVFGINANNCRVKGSWTTAEFQALNNFVVGLGPSLVWYLPINEPWTGGSITGGWNSLARSTWTGTFLVADSGRNKANGTPFFGVPHDYTTVNACTDEAAFDALESGHKVLVTTDCTGTLNPGPDRAAHLTKVALQAQTPFVVYDFRGQVPDSAVIVAMGQQVHAAP